MIQTLILIVMLAAGGAIAGMNTSVLHSPVTLSLPGLPNESLTVLQILAGMGGMLVLLWLAGMMDLVIQRVQIRRRDGLLEAKDLEIMRIKAEAYDQQRPALAEIRARLEKLTPPLDRGAPVRPERASDEATRGKPEPSLTRG
jgi:hypothetical protein